nr:MAG TPA: hypothetical protein [Caudoviricetes sp.]
MILIAFPVMAFLLSSFMINLSINHFKVKTR